MSEHKQKKPGEVKGLGYREEQKKPIRARWVRENKLSEKWFERHVPGYQERKRKAEIARKAKQSPGQGKDAASAKVAPTGQETPKNEEARSAAG